MRKNNSYNKNEGRKSLNNRLKCAYNKWQKEGNTLDYLSKKYSISKYSIGKYIEKKLSIL